jgi:hypothetical protein
VNRKIDVPAQLSRRSFLVGASTLGAATLLGACGSSSESNGAGKARKDQVAALRVSSDSYRSDQPQRFAFVVTKGSGFAGGPPARVGFVAPGQQGTNDVVNPTYHGEGLGDGRGVYVSEVAFPVGGVWKALVEVDGARVGLPFQVTDQPAAPIVGQTAPRSPSPSTTSALGVDPICTQQPPCDLHTTSADQIIGTGRPAVVLFATPARCQTRYCGPVLEMLLVETPTFRDRIDFAHVEIYQSPTGDGLVPTVEAWGLQSEPWMYAIAGDGTIAARLDGAFDRSEIRKTLEALAA